MERRGREQESEDEGDRLFRSIKRRRGMDGSADFTPGSIIHIRLRHLMCYDDTEISMGPRMNLILGQNGSGKSAIAAGIMLGCGYEVRNVGERFKKASDVINRGAREAYVDMEMIGMHGERLKLQRTIPREGRERYKINGRVVTMKEYRKKVQELNIRTGSILQFLPQEKVVEFSKNTHSGILRETESIMDETGCKQLHDELISVFKKRQSDHGMDEITPLQEDVQRLTRELKECEKTRDRMERKKELNLQIKSCSARKLELETMVAKETLDEKVEQGKKLQGFQQEARIKKEKAAINGRKASEKLEKEKRTTRHLEERVRGDLREWRTMREKLVEVLRESEEIRHQCSTLQEDKVVRQKEIQKCERELDEKRKSLADKLPLVELENACNEQKLRRKETTIKLNKCRREESAMRTDYHKNAEEIKDLRGTIDRIEVDRVRNVTESCREFQEAYEWVKRTSFRERVVPVISSIFCSDPIGYKFLENVLGKNVFRAFLCTHPEDRNTIMHQTRNKKWRILAVMADVRDAEQFIRSLRDRRPLSSSGFCYLDQMIQAQPIVLKYMCDMAAIHAVVCGIKASESECEERLREHNVVLSREYSQRKIISQYDRSVETITSRVLLEPRVLRGGRGDSVQDMEEKLRDAEDRQKKLSALLSQRSEEVRALEKEHATIISLERDAARRIQGRRRLETDIVQIQKNLERLRRASDSNDEAKLREAAMKVNEKIIRAVQELANAAVQGTGSSLELSHHVDDSSRFEEEVRYYQAEERNADMMVRNVRIELEKCTREREGLLASYEQKRTGFQTYVEKMSDFERKHFETEREKMSDDVDQLSRVISEMMAEIRTIYDSTSGLRDEEVIKKELRVKETRLHELQERWNDREREAERKKKHWKELVKPVITRIDESFQSLALDLGLPSKVLLSCDADDPEKWGIQIQIQFNDRDTLRTLSGAQHSGGERSVVTMLYLLSLQKICCFPFFLVDEINQGMDHRNEHRVFQLILKSCQSRQCFFVSPKLLNGMIGDSPEVRRNLTCIFVLTGAGNHLLDGERE